MMAAAPSSVAQDKSSPCAKQEPTIVDGVIIPCVDIRVPRSDDRKFAQDMEDIYKINHATMTAAEFLTDRNILHADFPKLLKKTKDVIESLCDRNHCDDKETQAAKTADSGKP